MSKKKKENITNMLNELMIKTMLKNGGIRRQMIDNAKDLDYTQQVEQIEKLHEQEDNADLMYIVMMLMQGMKVDHHDLKEVQKYVKKLRRLTDEHGSFDHNMKKGQKKHSKQIGKLKEQNSIQQSELKKCHKQLKKQTKTIRMLAAYLDLGTMSDDLVKIQKRCEKEMNHQRGGTHGLPNKKRPVIDVEYREVK